MQVKQRYLNQCHPWPLFLYSLQQVHVKNVTHQLCILLLCCDWLFQVVIGCSKQCDYKLKTVQLRSFHCFAVCSSSAHEGKIIVFERFHCSLTNINFICS